MSLLVIAAHVDPHQAAPLFRAALPATVELCAFVEQGLSSAYHALAARLRVGGRLLPGLLRHAGAQKPAEAYEKIVLVSWSAPYALAEELLIHPADAAAIAGWVALDSGYGNPTPGVCDLARRARAGTSLYWAGYTDVPTTQYLSSGQFLDVVKQKAGAEAGLFHVEHWAHDAAALAAAADKGAFWRNEHIGALHKGPAFVASALQALLAGTATQKSPSTTADEEPAPSITLDAEDPSLVDDTGAPVTDGPQAATTSAVAQSTSASATTSAVAQVSTRSAAPAPRAPARGADARVGTTAPDARSKAVVDFARAALKAGVKEQPLGSNKGPEVDGYLRGCVRGGRALGVLGVDWCAAFASACVYKATYGDDAGKRALGWAAPSFKKSAGEAPVGWRAAVHELVSDARATGTWHDAPDDDGPSPGDLIVMKRSSSDPRDGAGLGHVAVVDEVAPGGVFFSIGGNESNVVKRTARGGGVAADQIEAPVGWIKVSR